MKTAKKVTMNTKQQITFARTKGYAICQLKRGTLGYSSNGYEWTYVQSSSKEFTDVLLNLEDLIKTKEGKIAVLSAHYKEPKKHQSEITSDLLFVESISKN